MIKNIFFDFDGVLAESVNVKTEAFYKMYLPYGKEIADKVMEYHKEHGGISRYEKFRIWHKEHLNQTIDEAQVQELAQQFSNLVVQGVIDSAEVTGATYFLKKYQNQLRYWVITGTPTIEIERIIAARNMGHYFEGLHGSPEKKPHWTEYLLEKFDLKREETLFLGDATTDYKAAQHSNLLFAWRENEESRAYFQDYQGWVFQDFYSLEKIIAQHL